MRTLFTFKWILLGSILLCSPLVLSLEADNNSRYRGPTLLADHQLLEKDQAISIAKRRNNGKVLSADLVRGKSKSYYKIKMLNDKGRVKTVKINATKNH
jgi:uncharacterized membrane protein YkoI